MTKKWCGCGINEECKGHTMKVVIDGKEQPHLNAYDYVLKFALEVKTGKRKPLENISQ